MSDDDDDSIPPHVIKDALQRVVASREFMNSERKRRFLKFVVQETLAGRADRIKAYAIAVDVFDRDASFDPVADPVVRIEAGRLRRCLEHYYLTEGAADRIRIIIPKGGYVPHFIVTDGDGRPVPEALDDDDDQPNAGQMADIIPAKAAAGSALAVAGSSSPPVAPSRLRLLKRPRWLASILSLLLVLIIGSWGATLILQTPIVADGRTAAGHDPSLMVVPFSNDSGDPTLNSFAKSITEDVIGGLIGFENVLVFGVGPGSRSGTETALRAAVPDIDYVLKGRINTAGNQIQINVALLRAADNQYLWSGRFCREFSPGTIVDVLHGIAMQVARVLAQPHGVIDKEDLQNTAGVWSRSLAHQDGCL